MKFLKNYKKIPKNKGAAMLVSVIFFLFISLAIIAGLVSPTVRGFNVASADSKAKSSYFLAESGVEDAIYRILKGKPITGSEDLSIGSNSTTTIITTVSSNQRQIESFGDVSDFQRSVTTLLTTSSGVSFNYGVQVGQGGITLDGSSGINGNVYANGPIIGSTSSFISGTAISGNSPALTADQSNESGTPSNNVTFGNVSGTQDVAQSFQVSTSSPVNKVQFYIKKISTPSNATVKIVNDSNGSPGTNVFASGTLTASSVTTSYGWIDVAFTTNPLLNVGTTYWVVIDASTSSSKYYILGASAGGYANGLGKIGQQGGTWNSTSPSGLDYFFKVYLGGVNGLIQGSSLSQYNQLSVGTGGTGSAQAHTVQYTEATGLIYCQTGTGNNKSCTSQADPVYQAMPISDANIVQWKNDAGQGGIYVGTYNTPDYGSSNLGPRVITGDLIVDGGHTLNVTGTLYVKGNVIISGSAKIVLASSYGNTSGIVLSDGVLDLEGSGQLNGNGQAGSYILFITTSNSASISCGGYLATICVSGSAGSVILNAQKGTIVFIGSANAKEATAYQMYLVGDTRVDYESGLANINFTSGPSGTWSVQDWKEIE